MIVLGIDPGSRRTGWGVVRVEGSSVTCVAYGEVATGNKDFLAAKLKTIFEELTTILERYDPDHIFLESVFHHKSAQSTLVLGQARGVALLAAARQTDAITELAPAEIKKAVTGRGRADKTQVQEMVRILLGLDTLPPADAADALAIAITGGTRLKFRSTLEART